MGVVCLQLGVAGDDIGVPSPPGVLGGSLLFASAQRRNASGANTPVRRGGLSSVFSSCNRNNSDASSPSCCRR